MTRAKKVAGGGRWIENEITLKLKIVIWLLD